MSRLAFRLPLAARAALWALVCMVPLVHLGLQYSPKHGFAGLLTCGTFYLERALPALREVNPPAKSLYGYDGQFYAQMALDPSLRTPEFVTALDLPAYRARRIGLPVLAWIAGLGSPRPTVQAYALLNVAFWYALLFGMWKFLRPITVRENLCVLAACLTSGAMFSIQRALLDLPAATLAFYGASIGAAAMPAFLAAILTKDTYFLALLGIPAISRDKNLRALRYAARIAVVVLPVLAWYLYVEAIFGRQLAAAGDFAWPFAGYYSALSRAVADLQWVPPVAGSAPVGWAFVARALAANTFRITEILAPLSLLVQLFWLLFFFRRWDDRLWRVGCGFGIASVFLSHQPFIEQMSYCRDTIPLTLAFNVCLLRTAAGQAFLPWFFAGNIGLVWGLLSVLGARP